MMTEIILTIAAFFTSVLSAVLGMAGGVTLLGIMTFFMDYSKLIPIHGCVQLVSNSSRAYFLKEHVIKKLFFSFIFGVPLGAAAAVFLVKTLDSTVYFRLTLAAFIFYAIFKPKKLPHLKIPLWSFFFIGILGGFMGMLVGATGPLLAVFFIRDDFNKEQIVATKAATQFVVHLLKIPAFLHLGFNYAENWVVIVSLSFAAIVGTKYGVKILGKVDEDLFKKLFKSALFLSGVRILYKVFLQ